MVHSYQPVTPLMFIALAVVSVVAALLVLWSVAALGDHVFVQEERAAALDHSAVAARPAPAHLAQAGKVPRG